MEQLKPCPFCGSLDYEVLDPNDGGMGKWFVFCHTCEAESGGTYSYDSAVKNWNRRASGWISVKDRLPGNGDTILLYDCHEGVTALGYTSDGLFWIPEVGIVDDGITTHWMPLPDPPDSNTTGAREEVGAE